MYIFLLSLLPLSFAAFCFWRKDRQVVPVAMLGFITAVIVCLVKVIFTYAHRVIPYVLADNFEFFLLRQILAPVILLYGLFFAISRDSIGYKIKSYFPLMSSFYMVYMPYVIISSAEPTPSAFQTFVQPVILLSMLAMQAFALDSGYKFALKKKIALSIVSFVIFFAYMLVPPLLISMYMLEINFTAVCALTVLYCLIPSALIALELVFNFFLKKDSSVAVAA